MSKLKEKLTGISPPAVLFIVGATATGKSDIACYLAPNIDGEIVSADSMQIYKYMDIATAKPSQSIQKEIRHHLIDIVDPGQEYNTALYVAHARKAIKDIISRGKIPIITGGTGLYVRALLKGVFEGAQTNINLRKKLNEDLEKYGVSHMFKVLEDIDPSTASKIDCHNPRRILRALEVFHTEKKALIDLQTQWKTKSIGIDSIYSCLVYGVKRERNDLYKRINARVEKMFTEGVVDECRLLIEKDIEKNNVALQALGYKDIISYLRGEISLEDVKESIKTQTRNYAKRQGTWFRKEENIMWIDMPKEESASVTASRIIKLLETDQRLNTSN
ncbi:MAG: tRNA (adenosine(37)-N6)-dimethylallyltransferase MiaA [Candidatus Ancaeobacter aquaticus]|nr:tRNA (adenosine(37)-N6)-dimethylallyltransferase MiaA [Candidatus Ancaeobacter aquaticus]